MDTLLTTADRALRTVFAHHHASRANPANDITDASLSEAEKRVVEHSWRRMVCVKWIRQEDRVRVCTASYMILVLSKSHHHSTRLYEDSRVVIAMTETPVNRKASRHIIGYPQALHRAIGGWSTCSIIIAVFEYKTEMLGKSFNTCSVCVSFTMVFKCQIG